MAGLFGDLRCCRRRSGHAGPKVAAGSGASRAAPAAKGSAEAAWRSVPPVLRVVSPNQQRECSGDYELLRDRLVNGHPYWRKRGAERWLYTGFDGRWYVCGSATQERNFECASGYIYNVRVHKGALPDQVGGAWEWSGGLKWHRDPDISVVCPGPEAALSTPTLRPSPSKQTAKAAPSTPALRPPPSKQTPKVASSPQSPSDAFYLGPHKQSVPEGQPRGDSSRLREEGLRVEGCGKMQDALAALHSRAGFSSGSGSAPGHRSLLRDPPKLLCVISPNGQRECAGTYELVSGEWANGYPLWRQQGGERWLYSGTMGRWCICGRDVREDKYQRNSGFISQTTAHKGAMPDRTSGVWQRWAGESFEKDDRITVVQLHEELQAASPDKPRPPVKTLDLCGKSKCEGLDLRQHLDKLMIIVV